MHACILCKNCWKNSIVSTTAFASLKMSKFGKVYHGVLRGPPENLFALLQYLANGLHVFFSYQHIHVHVPLCQLYRWQEKTVPWLKSALSFLNCSKFLFFFFIVPIGRNQPLKPEKPKWKSDVPLTTGQLQSKRDEFWETAPAYEGRKEIWDALRGAASALESGDFVLSQAIIDGANISCPNGKSWTEWYRPSFLKPSYTL